MYSLHSGNNLISYPLFNSQTISDAIPNDVENEFLSTIGEGVATIQIDGEWVGVLTEFEPGRVYWVNVLSDLSFSYDSDVLSRESNEKMSAVNKFPEVFEFAQYKQSTQQAFYFVSEVIFNGDTATENDWILSYCGDVVSGARQYSIDGYMDIPVMGYSDDEATVGYCQIGDIPTLKLLKETGEIFNLDSDLPPFENNGIFIIESIFEENLLPDSYGLENSYPNPFNPTTTINFAIPIETQVFISIHNLQGREVVSLANGSYGAGYHQVLWNADAHSSGLYFVKMVAGGYVNTQKLMLVK